MDLNKLDTDELNKEKDNMEVIFKRHSLKPGDPGFKYDLQEEFVPTADNEWDMDDDEDIV